MNDDADVTVTLSAVCDACATTLQRVVRMAVQPHGWAMLRLEWWQTSQRVCGHNDAGVRFVMQREERTPLQPSETRGVCSACGHPMDGFRCPNEFCLTNER